MVTSTYRQPETTAKPVVPHASESLEAPGALSGLLAPGVKCTTWVYLEPWDRAGRHRLYLFGHTGQQLGWKNFSDGRIVLTYERDQRLTRAVLGAATPQSLDLRKDDVPRVPVRVPGGSFVSALTRTYTTIHIGRHWQQGQFDRLYCTAADPIEGVYDLGWVDLATGDLHPTHAALPRDWSPAEIRLQWMLDRRPVIS